MDNNLLMNAGTSAGSVAIVLIVYKVLKAIIGKRFISDCCGHRGEIGIDVRNMSITPPKDKPLIETV
jgi:hypothetical protein